jgi:hypothetical protein
MALKDIKVYTPRDVSLKVSSIIDEAEDKGAVFVARRGRVHAIILPTTLQGILNGLDCYEEFLDLEANNQTETLSPEFQAVIANLKRVIRQDLERVRTKQTIFRESVQNLDDETGWITSQTE